MSLASEEKKLQLLNRPETDAQGNSFFSEEDRRRAKTKIVDSNLEVLSTGQPYESSSSSFLGAQTGTYRKHIVSYKIAFTPDLGFQVRGKYHLHCNLRAETNSHIRAEFLEGVSNDDIPSGKSLNYSERFDIVLNGSNDIAEGTVEARSTVAISSHLLGVSQSTHVAQEGSPTTFELQVLSIERVE